ncbi:MAG: EamA family transporter [Bacteroidales bacterium]|nr:EamA family transporter [Bacteroidales bacterium]
MYTLVAILITIVWGTTFFIVKDTVENVNEYFIVMVRNSLAALLIIPYALKKNKKALFKFQSLLPGMLIGFLLATTYTSQTIGLKFTSSGHSAFITGSAVIAVPFIMAAFFGQKLRSIELISTGLVLIGIFLLTYDVETDFNKGDLITIITLLAYAFHMIYSSLFVKKVEVIALVTHQFFWAAVFSGLAYFILGEPVANISPLDGWMLLYLGAIGTLFCYFASVWVLKYMSAVKLIVIFALEPVFASIFAYFFADEVLSFKELSGSLIIISSIIYYQVFDAKRASKAI